MRKAHKAIATLTRRECINELIKNTRKHKTKQQNSSGGVDSECAKYPQSQIKILDNK